MQTFTMVNLNNGQIIAEDLTLEQVDAWWAENENAYFGLRVKGDQIQVVPTEESTT